MQYPIEAKSDLELRLEGINRRGDLALENLQRKAGKRMKNQCKASYYDLGEGCKLFCMLVRGHEGPHMDYRGNEFERQSDK